MNRIIRNDVRDRIRPHIRISGEPLRRMSACLMCGLDSGPWLTKQAAEISGLLHLSGHHPEIRRGAE